MKRRFYLSVVVLIAIFLITENVQAQTHCAQPSGSGVCTPNQSLTVVGFYPPDTSLPCAVVGVPYDQVIQFRVPDTTQGYTINWIEINEIYNLPCGLCWRSSNSSDRINGNSTGCVRVTGTTYDAPGEYMIAPFADVQIQFGFIPITLANVNIDSVMGLKYYARVQLPGGTCVPVDTSDPGLTAHAVGTAPTVTLAGATSVCTGGSSTFSISNAASYYAYKWSTGAFTSSINVSTGGTYTVTAYAACASATATRTLVVNSPPTPTITASGPTTFCTGGSVTLDAGAGYSNYAWSNGASTRTIMVSQSGVFDVTVTQNGCPGTSANVTVTVNTTPVPVATPLSATTFCAGDSVVIDAGAGYSAYAWSNGATTQTITASQSGNYNVTVTQNGCTGTSNTVTVIENNIPAPVVNASGATTFCAGGSVTLDAGPGYTAYLWSSGAATQSIVATQSGTYDVTVTENGCTGSSNAVVVTVNAPPFPTITPWGPVSFCVGGDVWLEAGSGYASYAWSTGDTTSHIIATQSDVYDVTVTQNGCSGISNSITVTVTDPTPTITANGPTTFCTGGSVTLDAGPGFDTYAWSNLTTAQTAVITTSGTYDVTTTLNGCTGTSTAVVVTVSASTLTPVITANPSFNICPGGSAALDAGAGYTTYLWNTTSATQSITESTAATYTVTVTQGNCTGTASATLNVGNFPVAVSISPAAVSACVGDTVTLDASAVYDSYAWSNTAITATTDVTASGTYYLTVTSNSCVGTDSVVVNFNLLPVPAISPAGPISACVGDAVTLDAGASTGTFSWSNSAATQTIQPLASGNYSVTVTENGCEGSDTVEITFNAHPVVAISPAGPVAACAGDSVALDAGAGFASYVWSDNAVTQTTHVNASGVFVVTVTQNGCEGTDTVEVIINPLPQPSITPAGPVSVCVGDNVLLDAGNGFSSYTWSNGDLVQTTQPVLSGVYIVTVVQNGCTGSDSVEVTFNATPHATISPAGTQTICSGESVTLDAGAGYDSYIWITSETTQTITVDTPGTYDVIVTENGCSGIATNPVTIVVNENPVASLAIFNPVWGDENPMVASPANAASYIWQSSDDTITGMIQIENTSSSNTDTAYCMCAIPSQTHNNSRSFFSCGFVRVVIVNGAGCRDTSGWVKASCVGAVNALESIYNISLQPNPANDVLNISYDLNRITNVSVAVLDLTGRVIRSVLKETQTAGEHRQQIRLSDISSGIYLLNVTTDFGSMNSKFVKE